MNETDAKREHTAECHERGCTNGSHPAPRPGHRTGGPWTPEQVLTAAEPTGDLRGQIASIWTEGGEDAADAVLALPAVRDALAAQEAVKRVEELADRLADEWDEGDDEFCSGQVAGLRDAADRLRRALDGDPS